MDALNIITGPIEKELAKFRDLQDELIFTPNPLLRDVLTHVGKHRGKQMRPMLVFLMAKIFGEINENTYYSALALELLHTASLVHDDVVDESEERRGQPSVNAVYNNQLAVLVGDYLLSTCMVYVAKCRMLGMTDIVGNLGQQLADGEIEQMLYSHQNVVSEEIYFDIIRKKTASLFVACAKAGVLSVGGSEADIATAQKLGEFIGLCFQIRDDIFDYYHDDAVGKPTGNDMREGKLTLPIIYAVQAHGNEHIHGLVAQLKKGELSNEGIDELITFAKEHGGIEYAEAKMDYLREEFVRALPLNIEPSLRDAVLAYIDLVIQRKK